MIISLTICALGVVGLLSLADQKYRYETGPTNDCEITTDEYEYTELSSEAQEAFDSALEADSALYITHSSHGFELETGGGMKNCVRKGSQSYVLTVEKISRPNPFLQVAYGGMSVVGFFLALFFGVTFAGSVRS